MYPIHVITQEKRDTITSEIQKWNPVERTALTVENLRLLPLDMVKLVASFCNDLVEQKSFSHTNISNSSTDLLNDKNPSETYGYFSILEVQANDLSIQFRQNLHVCLIFQLIYSCFLIQRLFQHTQRGPDGGQAKNAALVFAPTASQQLEQIETPIRVL
jgi:hypothetical protein